MEENITIKEPEPRVKTMKGLGNSEEQYRFLLEFAPVAILVDVEGRCVYANTAAARLWGTESPAALIGKTPQEMVHPDSLDWVRQRMRRVIEDHQALSFEEGKFLRLDGSFFEGETTAIPIDYQGNPGILVVILDLTERKQMENLLVLQRDLGSALGHTSNLPEALRLCLEAVLKVGEVDSGGIYLVDPATGDLDLAVHNGLPPEFVAVGSHFDSQSPQARLISEGKSVIVPYENLLKAMHLKKEELEAKKKAHLQTLAVIPIEHQGQIIAALNAASRTRESLSSWVIEALEGIATRIGGILARIRTDEALQRTRQNLQTLFETIEDFLFVLDESGKIVGFNPSVEKRLGYSPEDLRSMSVLSVHPPDRREEAAAIVQEMLAGKTDFCPVPLLTRNGQQIPVETRVSPGLWNDGPALFGISRDITERLKLETEIQEIKKAESLGRMAGSIAHHYNNLLGVVLGNLSMALEDLSNQEGPRGNIEEAIKASRRAAEISQLMLSYLGQGSGKKDPEDLSEICRSTISSLPEDIKVYTHFPEQGPLVRGDKRQLHQVLTSLIQNAADALEEKKGTITADLTIVQGEAISAYRFYPAAWKPQAGKYACLSVTDTGEGMPPEIMEKIFDPFFSTRFTGRGLGLPVVTGIVRSHEGAVTVESSPGKGSVFSVFLPILADRSLRETRPLPAEDGSPGEPPLILMAEDDTAMREMGERMMVKLGYQVITAVDGMEALSKFQEFPDRFQGVLLDLTMPRMDGWETLAAVRKMKPEIPAILASGYDEAQVMNQERLEMPQVFLHKPYTLTDLKAALTSALARGRLKIL
jgi:PAS domain S-box-containing protein